MKKSMHILLAFALTATVGCASAPTGSKNPAEFGIRDNCDSWLTGFGGQGPGNPSAAKVMLDSILLAGTNLASYEACERYSRLRPAPDSTIHDGSYISTNRVISIALPGPITKGAQPGIQVWEGDPSGIQKVYFVSTQSDGPVYGAYVLRWLVPGAAPKSLAELENKMFHTLYSEDSGVVPDEKLEYVYKENVTLDDGSYAIFEIVKPNKIDNDASNNQITNQNEEPYLIYYLIKPQDTDGVYTVLSIFWKGDCLKCKAGPEAEIRKMDSGITKFVNSFRFTDTH